MENNIEKKVADLRNKLTPLYNLATIMNETMRDCEDGENIKSNKVVKDCVINSYNSLPIIRNIIDSMLIENDEHEMLLTYRKLLITLLNSIEWFMNSSKSYGCNIKLTNDIKMIKEMKEKLDEKLIG